MKALVKQDKCIFVVVETLFSTFSNDSDKNNNIATIIFL